MATIPLAQVVLSLGIISITGAFAFLIKKLGSIVIWGITSMLILVALTFEWQIGVVLGLGVMSFLISIITVLFDG